MPFPQAAIGCGQLERIDALVGRKRQILDSYRRHLSGLSVIAMNPEPSGTVIGAWMPTVVFAPGTGVMREQIQAAFNAENIDARVFFWPLSGLPIFGGRPSNPIAESVAARAINLPSFHDITDDEIRRVSDVIRELAGSSGRP